MNRIIRGVWKGYDQNKRKLTENSQFYQMVCVERIQFSPLGITQEYKYLWRMSRCHTSKCTAIWHCLNIHQLYFNLRNLCFWSRTVQESQHRWLMLATVPTLKKVVLSMGGGGEARIPNSTVLLGSSISVQCISLKILLYETLERTWMLMIRGRLNNCGNITMPLFLKKELNLYVWPREVSKTKRWMKTASFRTAWTQCYPSALWSKRNALHPTVRHRSPMKCSTAMQLNTVATTGRRCQPSPWNGMRLKNRVFNSI